VRYFKLSPELADGLSSAICDGVEPVVMAIRAWLEEFRDEPGESFSVEVVELDPVDVENLPDI
jgi:hypothetical protein